jgi:hypothetical protein
MSRLRKGRNTRVRKEALVHRLALLLSVIALPLAVTATAAANSTQSQIVTFHETNPFVGATNACGFPIDLRTDGSFEITDYFDNSGTLFKEILHNHGRSFHRHRDQPGQREVHDHPVADRRRDQLFQPGRLDRIIQRERSHLELPR